MSPRTVAKHIRSLSGMFGKRHGALKLDLIPFNPFNPFDRESAYSSMDGVKGHPDLTDDQITALLDACPSSTWRSTVALCIYAGLRIGETFLLEWGDVSWGNGKLSVTSEKQTGGKSRQRPVKMEPELEKVLLEGFEAGDKQPNTMSKNNLGRDMEVIVKRSGLEPWKEPFQALRRWRDSTWKLNHPSYVVDTWLGHGAKVSRKHYLTPPEHLYRPPGKFDRITAMIKNMDDDQLDELEAVIKKIGATSAQR